MEERKNSQRSKNEEEVIYLVYTDVVGSCKLDERHNPIDWRKGTFSKQLKHFLCLSNSFALKSVGDALFVIYEGIDDSNEAQISKNILRCVWDAFDSTEQAKIRAVVHRITGHNRGEEIAECLDELKTRGNKVDLVRTLHNDIFGKEVNKAARILSLVRKPAILVSQDVVSKIDEGADKKAIAGNSIKFEQPPQTFTLHSPVPVLYMKGVFNYLEEAEQQPYVVWELGAEGSPTLAPEFKQNQAFRLITVGLKKASDFSTDWNSIVEETLGKLSLNKPDLKLRFYVDLLWKVMDYFVFQDPLFKRKNRKIDPREYLFSLKQLISGRHKKNKTFQIYGQAGKLDISADTNKIKKIEHIKGDIPKEEFGISLLAFTSFPDIEHNLQTRKLLSGETGNLISAIEPQSIEVYQNIKLSKELVESLDSDPSSSNFKGFAGKYSILLTFQVYFDSLSDADNLTSLFTDIHEIADDNLKVEFYGLTPGLIDGFVLYTYQPQEKWTSALESIVEKFISTVRATSFYYKVYPFAIFILEPVTVFDPLKRNIRYLTRLSEANEVEL